MKILHTSDWHIGRRLKNKDRLDEFIKFFDWLENLIARENIDILLVSGDIFDNTTPSVQAQNIYYSFLCSIAKSQCKNCVIISGNHDSPAFLDAPSDLLKLSNIHVVGRASQNPDDEIIILRDPDLIVCAVPYLRDRDVRKSDDNIDLIEKALTSGIYEHYQKVFARAKEIKSDSNIPVIAMGHLFARGGRTNIDDGTRSLYVGTSIEIGSDLFSQNYINYTALGHLHSPQFIKHENIRYSGSPIAMGFGEVGGKDSQKSVYIIELDENNNIAINNIPVPEFQILKRISGDLDEIFTELENLSLLNKSIWLDITYTGREIIGDLPEQLNRFTKKFPLLEILSIHNENRQLQYNNELDAIPEGLGKISPVKMLETCFDSNKTPESQRKIFITLYQEILRDLNIDYEE